MTAEQRQQLKKARDAAVRARVAAGEPGQAALRVLLSKLCFDPTPMKGIEHGWRGYRYDGCRCGVCRAPQAEAQARRRDREKQARQQQAVTA